MTDRFFSLLPWRRSYAAPLTAIALVVLTFGALPELGFGANQIISFSVPGSTGTTPISVNLSGTITGYYTDAQGTAHGFVRSAAGAITTFDAPGAGVGTNYGTFPVSINDSGEIAGICMGACYGFVRDVSGVLTEFDVAGAVQTYATAINNSGQVGGIYFVPNSQIASGFVRDSSGNFTTFSILGSIFGLSMNSAGQVAGYFGDANGLDYGYYGDPSGSIYTFGADGVSQFTFAVAIADNGFITGVFHGPYLHSPVHGFVRDGLGNITQIDISGAAATEPTAINASGTITGSYSNPTGSHGFVRDPLGNIVTFDDPHAGTGLTKGTYPLSINRYGGIAGYYVGPQGTRRGFFRRAE
jgi:predicted membrane protein